MKNIKLYIKQSNNQYEIFVVEDGHIAEYYQEENNKKRIEENIYLAKVKDVLKGMNACFIDIGEEKNALLHIKEMIPKQSDITGNEQADLEKFDINKLVKTGDEILVQIKKDSSSMKGAKATKDIKLIGKYVILMPYSKFVTTSKKIEDKKEKARLTKIANKIAEENNNEYGIIIRTASQSQEQKTIEKDFEELKKKWNEILEKSKTSKAPAKLYDNNGMIGKLIKDFTPYDLHVYTNDSIIESFVKSIDENIDTQISNINLEVKKARKIWLNCGGFITIDPTEALIAIDVNSGKFTGKKELKDTILKVNLEATKEIARQIRLQDLGGIILIDFIDMETNEEREEVKRAFEECVKADRSKVQVLEFTELGLLEVTRKHIFGR